MKGLFKTLSGLDPEVENCWFKACEGMQESTVSKYVFFVFCSDTWAQPPTWGPRFMWAQVGSRGRASTSYLCVQNSVPFIQLSDLRAGGRRIASTSGPKLAVRVVTLNWCWYQGSASSLSDVILNQNPKTLHPVWS